MRATWLPTLHSYICDYRQYRYETLLALGLPLEDELKWSDAVVKKFIKNYQGWHHRRLLITKLRNPQPELSFITDALAHDSKNYHTWSYRQWLLAEFNLPELWAGELAFVEQLLDEDLRNNSAWHHRYFVVFGSGVRQGDEDREKVIRRELGYVRGLDAYTSTLTAYHARYTKDKISIAPNNPSAWNYLRGVLEYGRLPMSTLKDFVQPYAEIKEQPDPLAKPQSSKQPDDEVVDLDNPLPTKQSDLPVPFAIEFLGDVAEEHGEQAKAIEVSPIVLCFKFTS